MPSSNLSWKFDLSLKFIVNFPVGGEKIVPVSRREVVLISKLRTKINVRMKCNRKWISNYVSSMLVI